jgi:mono/diheme cytochrome c family protein
MRIKTLGVVLIIALSLFTAFYWVTDPARREAAYQDQLKGLVAYGQQMFGPPTAANDHTANCAGCHGAEPALEEHLREAQGPERRVVHGRPQAG